MDEYDEYVDGDGDEDEYANDDYLEERARSRKPSKEDEEMSHRLSSEPPKELSSALAVVATPPLISSRPSTAVGEPHNSLTARPEPPETSLRSPSQP